MSVCPEHGKTCDTIAECIENTGQVFDYPVEECAVDDGTHHSSDRIAVYRGSANPAIMCGKHAQSVK